jgi:hypothetical protein
MAYKKSKKIDPLKEGKIVENNWARYVRARDAGHTDYIRTAIKCDRYYRGEQWEQTDIDALDSEGRPHLTINTILSTVNTILGEQSSKRADVLFKPRRNSSDEVAAVLTKLYMQISDNNQYDYLESQVFADGIIQDRGYFDIRMNFDDHIEGEVQITAEDPLDILPDPDAKDYDPTTWNEVIKTKWLSIDDIEQQYGQEKADRLRIIAENGEHLSRDSMDLEELRDSTYGDVGEGVYGSGEVEDKRSIRAVRVVERQHRKLVLTPHFVDPKTKDMRIVPESWDEERTEMFAKEYGLGMLKKLVKKVRWTITADQVVLHDDWSPYKDFTIVPYFPYFRRGKPFGMVRNLLSPQEQLNKISSQELHIVNTTANSGWVVETGSLNGMTSDDLQERGAQTGLVLEYNRGSAAPAKIQPNQIPTGLDRIGQKAANNIKEISGVSDAMLGQDSPEVSGVAIQAKQNRGQIQIQVPLDNLARSRVFVAENIMCLIQSFYTEERVIQITNDDDPMKPREELVLNQMTPEGEVVNDMTLGEYDVVVSSMPARDTFDESQFAEALQLRQVGIAIPDDAIIEYSHLQRKAELAKRIRMITGVEQSPEQQEAAQMQQQIQMEQVKLELQKLNAEAANLQAQAQLAAAKAADIDTQPEKEMAELEARMALKNKELDVRMQLAELSATQKEQASETQSTTKIAAEILRLGAQQDKQQQEYKKPKDVVL